ncbi:hypothetical protein [Thermococcus alcaliphilus]|uniref:hypothetical protein n=1 Tax=Thermococcus alcaliphilus TaxID=139207 RepID=UPI002091D293|nr:hypothetical protein [Thermococcus alcaliphilus]MCO6041854.1 hypothetical protein [Thermococcus alcaliphilus]
MEDLLKDKGVLLFASDPKAFETVLKYARSAEEEVLNLKRLLGFAFKEELEKIPEKAVKVLAKQGAHIRQVYALEMGENYLVETFKDVTELTIVVGLKRDADVADLMNTLPIRVLKLIGYGIERIEKTDNEIEIVCRKGRIVLSGGIMLHGWIKGFEGFIFWSEKFE